MEDLVSGQLSWFNSKLSIQIDYTSDIVATLIKDLKFWNPCKVSHVVILK